VGSKPLPGKNALKLSINNHELFHGVKFLKSFSFVVLFIHVFLFVTPNFHFKLFATTQILSSNNRKNFLGLM